MLVHVEKANVSEVK